MVCISFYFILSISILILVVCVLSFYLKYLSFHYFCVSNIINIPLAAFSIEFHFISFCFILHLMFYVFILFYYIIFISSFYFIQLMFILLNIFVIFLIYITF